MTIETLQTKILELSKKFPAREMKGLSLEKAIELERHLLKLSIELYAESDMSKLEFLESGGGKEAFCLSEQYKDLRRCQEIVALRRSLLHSLHHEKYTSDKSFNITNTSLIALLQKFSNLEESLSAKKQSGSENNAELSEKKQSDSETKADGEIKCNGVEGITKLEAQNTV